MNMDEDRIRNIWCIGRAYAEHAKELGNEVPKEPMVFLKAGSCAVIGQRELRLPLNQTEQDYHYELEIALRFSPDLQFSHYACAIDLTNRTAQNQLKAKGQPWTLAKSFHQACPLSPWLPVDGINLQAVDLELKIDGQIRQQGHSSQLLFSIEYMRQYLIANYPVCPGDVYLSGTPAGVGPLHRGQVLEAKVAGCQWTWQVC